MVSNKPGVIVLASLLHAGERLIAWQGEFQAKALRVSILCKLEAVRKGFGAMAALWDPKSGNSSEYSVSFGG